MKRTVKLATEVDENLEILKLLISKQIKRKVYKSQVVGWALKELAKKIKSKEEDDENGKT